MSLLLIDDAGLEWPATSRKLREAFGSPYSGSEFVDYAIANLGFVGIDNYGASCQLRLRPSLVSEACWRGVSKWLRRSRSERVVVSWLGSDWSYELIRSSDVALRRVENLITSTTNARPDDFLSRRLGLDEISPLSSLGQIIRNWATLSAPSGQEKLRQLVEATLGNRYVVTEKSNRDGRVVFQEFGTGLFSKYETWRTCAVGAPMEEQPDRVYGRWVASTYEDVLNVREPSVAEVDAVVRWPHAGRMRMRYRRIIIPLNSTTDRPLLMGGSIINSGIDLRVRSV